jgi:ADP-ribosylglycohydrolase
MFGSIVGDVIGSAYEAVGKQERLSPMKAYNFDLFTTKSRFTDDTVCTLAIAEALLYPNTYKNNFQLALLHWCRRYPDAGYGGYFKRWLHSTDPIPYDSYGNGSAMRVSPVGFTGRTQLETVTLAEKTAMPTHGHPEGIKGAQAVALAVYLAHNGASKGTIKERVEALTEYDLNTPLEEIRPSYMFDVTCQGSVPQAIRAFLESTDFESAIRLAVSLGGDTDTQAAMAGGIAQAYYKKIPEHIVVSTLERLPPHFVDLILKFNETFSVSF